MRWDQPYELRKTQLEYDIFLVSNGGMGFTPGIEKVGALGGTELECNLLLEELAKLGLKVGSMNNIGSAVKSKGVECWPISDLKILDIKTKILINMRGINPPGGIAFQRVVSWLTDNVNPAQQYFMDTVPPQLGQRTVAVSDFHLSQCKTQWNPIRIHNMVPQFIYDHPRVKKDFNLFVYASAAMKGLPETLKAWNELRNHYTIKKSKLLVLSPGYDMPDMEELKKTKNVEFMGPQKIQDLAGILARAGGLFQVNTMPETFGLIYAFAEAVGCTPHALCLNSFGALKEVVNTPVVTNDLKVFQQNITDYSGGKNKCLNPKDFSVETIFKEWVAVLERVTSG